MAGDGGNAADLRLGHDAAPGFLVHAGHQQKPRPREERARVGRGGDGFDIGQRHVDLGLAAAVARHAREEKAAMRQARGDRRGQMRAARGRRVHDEDRIATRRAAAVIGLDERRQPRGRPADQRAHIGREERGIGGVAHAGTAAGAGKLYSKDAVVK